MVSYCFKITWLKRPCRICFPSLPACPPLCSLHSWSLLYYALGQKVPTGHATLSWASDSEFYSFILDSWEQFLLSWMSESNSGVRCCTSVDWGRASCWTLKCRCQGAELLGATALQSPGAGILSSLKTISMCTSDFRLTPKNIEGIDSFVLCWELWKFPLGMGQ